MVYQEHVPASMKGEEQWVCWRHEDRDGKRTKVPVDPYSGDYARANDPETWTDFNTALAYYCDTPDVAGVGFMFHEDGLYAGVDLDNCRDPATGKVDDWAQEIIDRLDSYTERSPSGTGYHVIVYGYVPDGGNRCDGLEMYDSHRYFTVTGDRVPGTPQTVEKRVKRLRDIHTEYIADTGQEQNTTRPPVHNGGTPPDHELLQKAKNAANGDKFQALWNGDTSGYESHSEADQALCTILAFWTGGDSRRIEELFERSGLVRDKWRDRPEYRERTIRNAIQHCSEYYTPPAKE